MSDVTESEQDAEAAAPEQRRYKLTIAYDGKLFHVSQKQEPEGQEPLLTVAGVLESTMIRVLNQPIQLIGSSRTDAGVHALGQVAQFDAATRIPIDRLAMAINARLPDDVDVLKAELAPPKFNAITGTVSKQYRYRLYTTERRPLDKRNYVYHCWTPLDVDAMNDAARRLVGEHDFVSFTTLHHGRVSTIRTIHDCRVERHPTAPETHVVVSGSGFLYNMVRIIAGTLVEVGRGRFKPELMDELLKGGERQPAGPTLPASGLILEWIKYGDGQ